LRVEARDELMRRRRMRRNERRKLVREIGRRERRKKTIWVQTKSLTQETDEKRAEKQEKSYPRAKHLNSPSASTSSISNPSQSPTH
jgi:hypothetical protein